MVRDARRMTCCKCGTINTVYGSKSIIENKKNYLCGLCRPKLFTDEMLELILTENKEG